MAPTHRCTLLLVLAVVITAGCSAPFGGNGDAGDDTPSPTVDATPTTATVDRKAASIAKRVRQRAESVETLQATMHLTTTTGNETVEITAAVAFADPHRLNITYLEPSRLAGTQIVSNGSVVKIYSPRTDSVVVRNVSGQSDRRADGYSGLLFGLGGIENATFEGNETLAGEDAIELSYAIRGSKVSLLLAGGQRTSRLSGPPDSDDVNVTVWIDRERWLPLKARMNFTGFEQEISYTVRYEDLTVGEELPDSRFELSAGEDAERAASTLDAMIPANGTTYDSYDSLAEEAGSGLPPRTLPGNATFQRGFSVGDANDSFYQLLYRGDTGMVQVQYVTENVSVVENDDTVTVDGRTVETTRMQGAHVLEYHCGDRTYLLIGTDRSTLLEAVRTMGCP